MMHREISNQAKRTTIYFDKIRGALYDDPSEFLTENKIRAASLDAHELNSLSFTQCPDTYSCVVNGVVPIPPRSSWIWNGLSLSQRPNPFRLCASAGKEKIFQAAKRLLSRVEPAALFLETSGGFDTSLAITVTRVAGYDVGLIGFASDRYEFRTEVEIQRIVSQGACQVVHLEGTCNSYFERLMDVPLHPLPNKASLFAGRHFTVLEHSRSLGIKCIINAIGADAFFCDALPSSETFPQQLDKCRIDDSWPDEFLYKPFGSQYKSVVSIPQIARVLWSLRAGLGEDALKIWAREYFADLLPTQLTKFAYKAGYDGYYEEGLRAAIPTIRTLTSEAYKFTRDQRLKPENLLRLVENSINLDHSQSVALMARLSYSIWLYRLHVDGFI